MTYKSDPHSDAEPLVKQVIAELDMANEALSPTVQRDISRATQQALIQARNQQRQHRDGHQRSAFNLGVGQPTTWLWATPAAVAMVAVLLVSYQPEPMVANMPLEMISGELLPDDMHLIRDMEFTQDLEFANWLVQQEQEAML